MDDAYYIICSSSFSADRQFHFDQIELCPIHVLHKTIETVFEVEKRQANSHSITAAHLASIVIAQFGGDKSVTPDRFLPFPSEPQSKLSDRTAKIFNQLLEQKLLPAKVIGACSAFLSDIKRYSK